MKKLILFVGFLLSFSIGSYGETISIVADNDLWGNVHTDQHYTHGTAFSYASTNYIDNFYSDFISKIIGETTKSTINIGQYLYSPRDITETEYQPDDRKFGGILYLGYGLHSEKEKSSQFIELDLGVIGHYSFGEETQKAVHKAIDSQPPEGWEHQVSERASVNLTYQYKNKLFRWKDNLDIINSIGGSIGNVHVMANAGSMIRAGLNVPRDFGSLKLEPVPRGLFKSFSLYGICGAEGRAVGYNVFLDGLEKEPFVGEHYYGFGAGVSKIDIKYLHTIRTEEFALQEDDNNFGSFTVTFTF
tara:strand:+ start:7163 stop:8068 length:906 start_codon:yes stop_codon:yes gene_type:complete